MAQLFCEVENLVEQQPDSALNLLDAIQNPYVLNKEGKARYYLLLVQAKDKVFEDISHDTLIFQSKNYYQKKKDMKYLALAEFYSGRVYQSQGESEKAMQAYLEAETTAAATNDDNLSGLITYYIGDIYYNQLSYDEAIDKFKQARQYFSRSAGNYKREIQTFNIIGNSYFIKEQRDSAFIYFNSALHAAEIHRDTIQQMTVRQNLGVAYRATGNFSLAKEYLLSALAFKSDEELEASIYLNLAQVYNELNLKDSVAYYTHTALLFFEKKNKASSLSNVYRLLASMAEKHEDYKQALEYHRKYSKYLASIVSESRNHNIQEVEKKYHFELLQNEKNRLLIEKQWILITLMILFFVTGMIFIYFSRRNMRQRIILVEAEQKICALQQLANDYDEKENTVMKLILEEFEIYKKAISMKQIMSLGKKETISRKEFFQKINEIFYGQKEYDWDKLFRILNVIYNNRFIEIKEQYSELTDEEFQITCLSCCDFDNAQIGSYLNKAENTVKQKKTEIRHKLGMNERENFTLFFNFNTPQENKKRY
jgi:tetratricopeptide (TPR) repeat protein